MFNNEIYVGRKGKVNNNINIAKFNNSFTKGLIIRIAASAVIGFVAGIISTL